ncbi:MAG: ribonuclease III [Alphaproteobacteria bacterium]|nr:ribonuclease III [Alphaproteobacteria bacterium]OJV13579.1 MAG: ribonuclease III [Alphaproteobacteria bacterium 33-17]
MQKVENWAKEVLKVDFADIDSLVIALTHASVGSMQQGVKNYEKLEFLGDSVLNLVVTHKLINRFPDESEGDLARRRAALVNTETLYKIAKKLKVDEMIILSTSEEKCGGRQNKRNLENALEAVIGAIYLDNGFAVAKAMVEQLFVDEVIQNSVPPRDSKTLLQEVVQKMGLPIPQYSIVSKSGPDHDPEFEIQLVVDNQSPVIVKAKSRKIGEKMTAEIMLRRLGAI